MGVLKDIKNLIAGLGITGKHLGRHAITIQYPEERWKMPERSRGTVVLLSDKETGELNCTGCLLCMKACPTGAIVIEAPRDEQTKKRVLKKFVVDHSICCNCGLCEEACNFCAIKLAPEKYEGSVYRKEDLVWDMHRLQEEGRDVDYVDTRKKKKPAPKPAAKKTDAPSAATAPVNDPSGENREDVSKPSQPASPDQSEEKS